MVNLDIVLNGIYILLIYEVKFVVLKFGHSRVPVYTCYTVLAEPIPKSFGLNYKFVTAVAQVSTINYLVHTPGGGNY